MTFYGPPVLCAKEIQDTFVVIGKCKKSINLGLQDLFMSFKSSYNERDGGNIRRVIIIIRTFLFFFFLSLVGSFYKFFMPFLSNQG